MITIDNLQELFDRVLADINPTPARPGEYADRLQLRPQAEPAPPPAQEEEK